MEKIKKLQKIAQLVRYWSLTMTTKAESGHPTSSMSATDLLSVLFFGGHLRFDLENPDNPANDRVIFSKGHATPLFYSLYAAAGAISHKKLMTYREKDSNLEGHPTLNFKYTEVATGSLGQGLSVGLGMALALRAQCKGEKTLNCADIPTVYVLLGDGEFAEGSVWEAVEVAGFYKVGNLVGILDVNRLGQSQQTMIGHNIRIYKRRLKAFGWNTIALKNGHDLAAIDKAFREVLDSKRRFQRKHRFGRGRPTMIIARTIKGKGVSFLENKNGWHGKPLAKGELKEAVRELGDVDKKIRGKIVKPLAFLGTKISSQINSPPSLSAGSHAAGSRLAQTTDSSEILFPSKAQVKFENLDYSNIDKLATRKAYGTALARVGKAIAKIVVLDGDVKNSTYSQEFKEKFPGRFFEMFIAEQNMAGVALGMQRLGFIPFASTFAAFWTRAFDQIRMAALNRANIKFVGSHGGVSIGKDGPSQMGLEDIAMFRSVHGCKVVYPADAVATEKLVEQMAEDPGMVYMRTTRSNTPIIYPVEEQFPIGGFKVHYLNKSLETNFFSVPNSQTAPSASRRGSSTRLGSSLPARGPIAQTGVRLPTPAGNGASEVRTVLSSENLTSPSSLNAKAVIIAAGITVYEALRAQQRLKKQGLAVLVIDCYSIKPIDGEGLRKVVGSKPIVVVEDHWFEGGLADAILNIFAQVPKVKIYKLAVTKIAHSATPAENLRMAGIDTEAIIKKAKEIA